MAPRDRVLSRLEMITSSNVLGAGTDRSPGFSPRRTRSPYDAACRYDATTRRYGGPSPQMPALMRRADASAWI
jgi:hypothetical protein